MHACASPSSGSFVRTASHSVEVDSSATPAQLFASVSQSAVSQSAVRVQVASSSFWPLGQFWATTWFAVTKDRDKFRSSVLEEHEQEQDEADGEQDEGQQRIERTSDEGHQRHA